jgi:hypothetical protein
MVKAAVRVYSEKGTPKKRRVRKDTEYDYDTVFVLDTETTVDEYQNLKFGSFVLNNREDIVSIGLFYNPNFVSDKELNELVKYCEKNPVVKLYTLDEFIGIFYYYVYERRVPCVGFNLPFDLSRLAYDFGYARGSMKGGFVFKLSEQRKNPPIIIKHNDSSQSFIRFQSTSYDRFSGTFLDLKTLAVTLTDDKHITLDKAAQLFNKKHKKLHVEKHGKITQEYIGYNLEDTLTTAELYWRLKEELEKYGIPIPLNRVYSSASLGKAWLEQIGIRPFMELNPGFPKDVLGYLMSAYYGGRAEVKIRKTPTRVTVLDFLSMYPTMFNVTGLYNFLIAQRIDTVDDTQNVRDLIEKISLEDLRDPDILKSLNVLIEILPDGDILPVRTKYNDAEESLNVGINHITSQKPMWYPLPDVVASKILSGRTPRILRAIRFVPKGRQKLDKVNTLGIEIDPNKDNIFKISIEKRQELKAKGDYRQKPIKILANASSYGIYIEMNPKDIGEDTKTVVYSNKQFSTDKSMIEEVGRYFNPIISVLITGYARLMLAIAEALLKRTGNVHAFCDTDSMAVPKECVKKMQDFFQPLNPYDFDKPLFKEEKKDVWFYGISAKRYVLYTKEGDKITIKDGDERAYSLHGLGHLLNPFGKGVNWHKQVWEDILKLHYGIMNQSEFIQKYSGFYAISKLSVSSKDLMNRFKAFNKGKLYDKRIKPFNFFLIGVGNNKDIKPITSFSKEPQESVHKPFIDYKSGNVMIGIEYWKRLSDVLLSYIDHKESKFDGSIGALERKHLNISNFIYIGKEASNLDRTGTLDNPRYHTYQDQETINKRLLEITPKEAKKIGIPKTTYYWLRKTLRDGKEVRLRGKTKGRLS